ncbi:helix-turn-helix domain-containing protein [Clostridium butyricum]|uniref:DNA-binding phage protein n=1 Tax=Clostridium butyricum E4 str. BoNT E BL5262 TaxID=632245 RepID=C4ILG7_CLOBU|nr:helix-turn-helix transcriptional regulator [Clostridium butyricum]EDT77113.1 immunity repressor protein [Clostridium butyricum 5521]EEP53090.1 DNA-binding phage protein [Clostridium butyricum E4 str. BoNT E BL5262]NFL32996.1 helix-turn-helix transcriptional regulator [Clostridium butyricum]NFS17965.1 helix-turn-helix transcriptional regulator [Clostridium butyricum]
MKTIGRKIEERLQELDLSQKDLADKVNVTEATISRYITGTRSPRGEILSRIAVALGLTTDYLLGNESMENDIKLIVNKKYDDISKVFNKKGLSLDNIDSDEFETILDMYILAKGIKKD